MKSTLCIEDLIEKLHIYIGYYISIDRKVYFKPNHIFDEDKSVKWNREEVERRNNNIYKQRQEDKKEKAKLYNDVEESIKKYIVQQINVTEEKAIKIYNFVFEDGIYNDNDFYRLDTLLDLFKDLKNI